MPERARKFVNFSARRSILCAMEDLSVSDAALATRARAGEVEALAALLERYRPSLYATAITLLRNRDDALDAVQETSVVALVRLGSLREPAAVGGWLHRVLRNTCLMRLRRTGLETANDAVDVPAQVPTPEDLIEQLVLRDWVWGAIDTLVPDDRVTVMLRYFSRCHSYDAIASMTGVPIGTVRSRLHRARSQLGGALTSTAAGSSLSQVDLERARRAEWEDFYAELHQVPAPRTYRDTYSPEVDVTDRVGQWHGVVEWSAHEREAIEVGVRANIVGLVASRDFTVLDIDFTNPAWADDHCPPRSTFVHHLAAGRTRRLEIHYV
jgi:RNA polymerase sigma-70 factor (ECF subfamily)